MFNNGIIRVHSVPGGQRKLLDCSLLGGSVPSLTLWTQPTLRVVIMEDALHFYIQSTVTVDYCNIKLFGLATVAVGAMLSILSFGISRSDTFIFTLGQVSLWTRVAVTATFAGIEYSTIGAKLCLFQSTILVFCCNCQLYFTLNPKSHLTTAVVQIHFHTLKLCHQSEMPTVAIGATPFHSVNSWVSQSNPELH